MCSRRMWLSRGPGRSASSDVSVASESWPTGRAASPRRAGVSAKSASTARSTSVPGSASSSSVVRPRPPPRLRPPRDTSSGQLLTRDAWSRGRLRMVRSTPRGTLRETGPRDLTSGGAVGGGSEAGASSTAEKETVFRRFLGGGRRGIGEEGCSLAQVVETGGPAGGSGRVWGTLAGGSSVEPGERST